MVDISGQISYYSNYGTWQLIVENIEFDQTTCDAVAEVWSAIRECHSTVASFQC